VLGNQEVDFATADAMLSSAGAIESQCATCCMISGLTLSFCQVDVVATSPSMSISLEYKRSRVRDI
jgi:hypothetical protein